VDFCAPRHASLITPLRDADSTGRPEEPPPPPPPTPPDRSGPHTRVPLHAPRPQTSASVHWSPSLHGMPSASVKTQPPVGSQLSLVHALPSSQVTGCAPAPVPPPHASPPLHALPSSKAMPHS